MTIPQQLTNPGPAPIFSPVPPIRTVERDPDRALDFVRIAEQEKTPTEYEHLTDPVERLRAQVESCSWYHTIELPGGIVTTGIFDHRQLTPHYQIPEDLTGKTVLDAATADGFWAFEFERRGGDVTAIDIVSMADTDIPAPAKELMLSEYPDLDRSQGYGFDLAHEALGSSVKKIKQSVYDLNPDDNGQFDLVHIGDALLHLQRPLDVLRALRSVCKGSVLVADVCDPLLSQHNDDPDSWLMRYRGGWNTVHWWTPSLDGLAQLVIDAGFSNVTVHSIYNLPSRGYAMGPWRAIITGTV